MQSSVMNCQKLNCLLFTAVALKEVNVVDVVFVVVFFGGETEIWNCFSYLSFGFSSQKEKSTFSSSDEEN